MVHVAENMHPSHHQTVEYLEHGVGGAIDGASAEVGFLWIKKKVEIDLFPQKMHLQKSIYNPIATKFSILIYFSERKVKILFDIMAAVDDLEDM